MQSVWDIPKGKTAEISGLDQSLSKDVVLRLHDMGFSPAQQVLCLQRGFLGGPVVVAVADAVFTLERQIASCILIAPAA
ncbi:MULTISPECIES: FeoA family protein [Rheinheimera]|uniref:Ferrous iron transport protein A n=1 Tax=Rheinheimera marina TaxID=1774958 RepID=A0ABV9JJB4_9GAMM